MKKKTIKNKLIKLRDKYLGLTIIALIALTFLSAGWFPFGLIDLLYESKKEIEQKWIIAYKPIIEWCNDNAGSAVHSIWDNNEKIPTKKDVISISDEKLKCLENPDYRIYLINNPKRQIKKNEEIRIWNNKIPKKLRDFKLNIENSKNLKKKVTNVRTNAWSSWLGGYYSLKSYLKSKRWIGEDEKEEDQLLCSQKGEDYSCPHSYYQLYYSDSEDDSIFILNFLTDRQFFTLSKACDAGCKVELTYVTDNNKNYIRGFKLLNHLEHTWPKYTDKDHKQIIKYDQMILNINNEVKELKKKYPFPEWMLKINL